MASYFLDSSAVLKRYVVEKGSPWVQRLFAPAGTNDMSVAAICCVEVVAAIARRVRGGGLPLAPGSAIIRSFRRDFIVDFVPIAITQSLLDHSMQLAERHGLRGYDAVQLAAALAAQSAAGAIGSALKFVSSDLELNAAAVAEGLTVEDPNTHP